MAPLNQEPASVFLGTLVRMEAPALSCSKAELLLLCVIHGSSSGVCDCSGSPLRADLNKGVERSWSSGPFLTAWRLVQSWPIQDSHSQRGAGMGWPPTLSSLQGQVATPDWRSTWDQRRRSTRIGKRPVAGVGGE